MCFDVVLVKITKFLAIEILQSGFAQIHEKCLSLPQLEITKIIGKHYFIFIYFLYVFSLKKIKLKKAEWTKVTISQKRLKNGKYGFRAQIGEESIYAYNNAPKIFSNVKLYNSAYPQPPDALFKELKYETWGKY